MGRESALPVMNRITFAPAYPRWLVAVLLTRLVGIPQFSHAADSPPINTNAQPATLEALVTDVLEHNPELNVYRAEMAAAKGERRTAAAWANPEVSTTVGQKTVTSGGLSAEGVAWSVGVQQTGYPSFSIGPYYSQERAGDREQQVGVGISLPLPLWNRNKGNVETAEARQRQAETSLYVTQRDLDRHIVQTAMVYQTKLTEMGNWRPESVDKFRRAAALADRHYRLGAVPIATYVELQKQYLEAVEALLDTRREALDAGQQIQLLTGLEFNAVQTVTPDKFPNP